VKTRVAGSVRRTADVVLCGFLLVVTAPILFVAMLAVVVTDGRPALFVQERDGYRGAALRVRKVRTMRRDAQAALDAILASDPVARDEWSRYGRLVGDPRVLGRLGRFLRRTSLDELPQIWQVVAGDMALVGPRPVERWISEAMDDDFRELRRSRRPGLTGPWQVLGRNDVDLHALVHIERDYLLHPSLWRDLCILAKTPLVVLRGDGAM
jgi:lipopolysaccharide/colanic/teichoic acid biosynthesis glycosyltransferase